MTVVCQGAAVVFSNAIRAPIPWDNAKSKSSIHNHRLQKINPLDEQKLGETGNRTQNLLHLTGAVKLDAKKMSYH